MAERPGVVYLFWWNIILSFAISFVIWTLISTIEFGACMTDSHCDDSGDWLGLAVFYGAMTALSLWFLNKRGVPPNYFAQSSTEASE